MNELIKIRESNGNQVVSAKELHSYLDSGRDFSTWFKYQVERCMFEKNIDFTPILGKSTGGRPSIDYAITIPAAKEIAMVNGGKNGKNARIYFISCEKQLKEQFAIPKTFSQALMLASKQAEIIELQQKQIEIAAPKVDFFDAVTDSKDAIDIGSAAKVLNLGIGRNRLFEFLRENGVFMSNNQPYQSHIDNGHFRTIEQKFVKPDGSACINIKTVVYQKGLSYIRKLYTGKTT